MAKGKKSFVLYADQVTIFTELPDDVAGKLIKHIFKYVNDEDPETDELIIRVAFASIKTQLKRDLKKYEERCKRNKTNGLQGGRPKTHKNPKKPTGFLCNRTEPKKPDNDNDNDNDNDKIKTWRDDFILYKNLVDIAFDEIINDTEEISRQEKYYPNVDIRLSLEKSINNFWGTEAGWKHKKKSRAKEIDMISTLINNLDKNKVYKPKEQKTGSVYTQSGNTKEEYGF